jgi:hypothetical protein
MDAKHLDTIVDMLQVRRDTLLPAFKILSTSERVAPDERERYTKRVAEMEEEHAALDAVLSHFDY